MCVLLLRKVYLASKCLPDSECVCSRRGSWWSVRGAAGASHRAGFCALRRAAAPRRAPPAPRALTTIDDTHHSTITITNVPPFALGVY